MSGEQPRAHRRPDSNGAGEPVISSTAGPTDGPARRPPWSAVIPRGVPRTYAVPPVALDRLLDDAAHDFPGGTATVHRGRELQWRQLQDLADRLATVLEQRGLGAGGRILVALPATPQAVVTLFAAWRVGAAVVLADPGTPGDELAALAGRTAARAAVVAEPWPDTPALADAVPHRFVTGAEDELPFPGNFAAMLRRQIRDVPSRAETTERLMETVRRHAPLRAPTSGPTDPDSVAALFRTGAGLVTHTHRQLLHAAFQLRLWLPDTVAGGERVVSFVPLHQPFGLTSTVTAPVLAAATLVLSSSATPRGLGRAVRRHDPTIVVLDDDDHVSALEGVPTSSLRVCLQPGPCDPSVRTQTERDTGARLRGWWAPDDSAGMVIADPIYGLTKPGTIGIPVTDTAAQVRAPDGATSAPATVGELWVAGPQLPAAGWHRTDLPASMDADGFVTLLDGGAGPPGPSGEVAADRARDHRAAAG